jgi:hypothetical protein
LNNRAKATAFQEHLFLRLLDSLDAWHLNIVRDAVLLSFYGHSRVGGTFRWCWRQRALKGFPFTRCALAARKTARAALLLCHLFAALVVARACRDVLLLVVGVDRLVGFLAHSAAPPPALSLPVRAGCPLLYLSA